VAAYLTVSDDIKTPLEAFSEQLFSELVDALAIATYKGIAGCFRPAN
jgi:hypothetical protein